MPTFVDSSGNLQTATTDSAYSPVSAQYVDRYSGKIFVDTGDGIRTQAMPLVGLTNAGVWIPAAVDGTGKLITPAAPAVTWGSITGTLSAQTDLQSALNAKQNSLGFTAENVANKSVDGTLASNSDTLYPSQKAVKTYADTKQSALGFTPENSANKSTDGTMAANSATLYPSQSAVVTYVGAHGGSSAWGGITGTLSNQTDLQNALNAKSAAFPATSNVRKLYTSIGGTDAAGCGTPVSQCATWSYTLGLITDASSTNRYVIHLGPGTFTESADVALKPWVWTEGEQYYVTRLAVTGGTNTIKLDNSFASGGSRAGFKNIYLSGSTKLNLDLQSLTNSGTPSFVFEAEHFWMNSTFTFKGRNATGQFDSFEIYDAFLLGNAVIEAGEANDWNVVQLGTTTITSTNGASSNTFVNSSFVGATTVTGNNTYSSVNQFQASGQGTSLTASGTQDLYLDGISSVAGFVPAAGVTLHCTDGSGCGQLIQLAGATAGTNAVINYKNGHIKSTTTTAPTAAPNANAGTGATCTVSNATDSAGTINLTTTGVASSSGVICDVTFNKAYGVAPICSATPTSSNAIVDAVIQGVYFTTSTTKLTINFANTDAIGRTYNWSYQCIETQ